MAEILHQLSLVAPPMKVYSALTDPKGLTNWWTRNAQVETHVNSISQFTFEHGSVVLRMKILRLMPGKAVVWHCVGGHPDWEDTQITFELEPTRQGTTLHFAQRGWKRTTGSYAKTNFDWARYLMSLRSFIEKGKGYPTRD